MQEKIEKLIGLSIFALAARLPYLCRTLFAKSLSTFLWLANSQTKKVTLANIRLCFPELEVRQQQRLAKQSLFHSVMLVLEIPLVWSQEAEKSLQQIKAVHGESIIKAAQDKGLGVIVVIPHLGNWEYLGLYLGRHYDVVSLYQPPNRAWFEQVTKAGRQKTGAKLVPTNAKGVINIVKALKRGALTAILPDQTPDRGNGAAYVKFFGHSVPTMTLVTNLLQKQASVAVMGFAKRLPNNQFEIIFQAVPDALYDKDETIACQALNNSVESLVRQAPEQYQWEYKRFRRGENGQKRDIYD